MHADRSEQRPGPTLLIDPSDIVVHHDPAPTGACPDALARGDQVAGPGDLALRRRRASGAAAHRAV